jgi:thiol-disulfide isomerase/thioredoxin
MSSHRLNWLLTLAIIVATGSGAMPAAEANRPMNIPFEGQMDAPEFPGSLEWLNTGRPLTLKDLRGKVVLLDFWTYCCINCMHIIPDLKKLEARYPNELVVIGVHSAKFDNEKETDNIREAIKRYEIEHPVINDRDFLVWRSYGVRAWPSLMLINPQGRVIGSHSGEGIFELFDHIIGETVKHFDAKGLIDRKPIELKLEKAGQPPALLSYPGKIVADEKSKRLVFSDSNHNRIIVASLAGEILEVVGDGQSGLQDGPFESARFFRPQGVCLDAGSEVIYVADTENHAIRLVDLKARSVKTVAGDGRQSRRFNQEGKGVELNSPWDVVLVGDTLYIAMAGSHQLWALSTKTLEARVYAGSGRENIADGPLKEGALAQPSGITTDGRKLYFADSEVSAVRSADLNAGGRVETLIGEGLFEFGDVDGKYPRARLQHPLGVAFHDGFIYVADTYNHKIKKLNPATKELTSFIGAGKRGMADGLAAQAQLNEPAGLCFADGKMFIADSNNHVVRVCDLKSGTVSTLQWQGLDKLTMKVPAKGSLEREILLEARRVSPDVRSLDFKITLPRGKKINPAGVSKIKISSADAEVLRLEKPESELKGESLSIPVSARIGKTSLSVQLRVFYCDTGNAGLCYFDNAIVKIPLEVSNGEATSLTVTYRVEK